MKSPNHFAWLQEIYVIFYEIYLYYEEKIKMLDLNLYIGKCAGAS